MAARPEESPPATSGTEDGVHERMFLRTESNAAAIIRCEYARKDLLVQALAARCGPPASPSSGLKTMVSLAQ
jgi:hypothetical protein